MTFLVSMICCIAANAQVSFSDQLEDAKFNIIKKTIEFLSTDTATFKSVKSNTCNGCRGYDDLKKFAADNNLINAGKNVIDPLSTARMDTSSKKWKAGLQQFRQLAHDKITGAGKEKRKQLKGYGTYVASLDKIVNEVIPDDQAGVATQNPPGTVQNPVSETANDTTLTSAPATAGNTASLLASSWIPYGLAAILLGLLIYLVVQHQALKQKAKMLEDKISKVKQEGYEFKETIQALTSKKEQLEKNLKDAKSMIKSLEDRASAIEKRKPPTEKSLDTPAAMVPPLKPGLLFRNPSLPPVITKFAKYADMVDGFSNAELTDTADNETIFELSIKPNNTGEYKIIDNETAQKYALMNVQYFLGKTCKYETFPMDRTRIQTDSPGTVKLNSGKWTIIDPARISFV